jgi:hypothetical protein
MAAPQPSKPPPPGGGAAPTGAKPSASDPADRAPQQQPKRKPLTTMGLWPEKQILRRELVSSLAGRFWAQPAPTTTRISGRAWTVPGVLPPLPLCAPTGLSRAQLLVAAGAVGLPGLPSYSADEGGVVSRRGGVRLPDTIMHMHMRL